MTTLANLPLYLTYDDVLLIPGYTDFRRDDISLKTRLTRELELEIPLVSAPMDTVTEAKLAIALGKLGGLGLIHRNLTVENQVAEVKLVKSAGLVAGAAVGVSAGYLDRAEALVSAGVDVVVLDTAHGYTKFMIDAIKELKKTLSQTSNHRWEHCYL